MKVSFFLDNSCRFDSRVLREAGALAARGHSLEIYAFREDGTDFIEEKDGFKIIRLPGIRPIKRFRALQFIYSVCGLLQYYYRCWHILKDKNMDVYHCHDLLTLPMGCLLKKKNRGQLIYDSHELYVDQSYLSPFLRFIYRILEKALIHHVDHVITVNSFIADELSKKYNIQLPSVVANYPAATVQARLLSHDSIRDTLKISDSMPIILYIGSYLAGRGLENLILSVENIRRGIVVFIGYGAAENKLKALVKEHNLTGKVMFAEPVAPDVLVRYVKSANLGIALIQKVDLSYYYCSPNKLFEYINAGLPVVCSDFPFMKSVVEGYEVGKTCNPDDPDSIANAINWVLEDAGRYQALKRNTLKAAGIFNWENESRKLIAIYDEMEKQAAWRRGKGSRCAA